ncbi:protein kinase [Niveibacterium sp. SC-1]|uniref:protein kinase domain-containing protein n=1 Tax=Niveibacterium sp. SC-1 TaxID=3135646 RepID=UPI00311FB232
MAAQPERIGKYKIIREIGRGATAIVYLAENPFYPEPIALKHISFRDKVKDEAKWNRRLLKLLRAEQSVAERLNHPNIIRIHETVIEEDQAYVVMEYFDGQSLERYCAFDKLMPVHRVVSIVFKCCMALDHAFKNGIVHRDIKPANILVDDQENVKITDFGLAMNVKKQSDADSTFIMGVGSPAYMSPEQIKSYPLNQKTDLYSLGVVLFHLLTGRLPFRARNPAQLVYKIINADPPSACGLNPEVPEQMDPIIRKALEKDLYSRYKNGAEFAKDLSAVRYKIVDERDIEQDNSHWGQMRRLPFFTEFDDVEVWETLRISKWRQVDANTSLIKEGSSDSRFGILTEGRVEISVAGRKVGELGPGEVFGESAFLDEQEKRQIAAVSTLTPVSYLEVNPAALVLASEECFEHFRTRLIGISVRRLAAAQRALAAGGDISAAPQDATQIGFELQLLDS